MAPLPKNILLGVVKVELPSGMVIVDMTVLISDCGAWTSPPAKPMVFADITIMKNQNGNIRYVPIIEFTSKEVCTRLSDAVIAALRQSHPEAFA